MSISLVLRVNIALLLHKFMIFLLIIQVHKPLHLQLTTSFIATHTINSYNYLYIYITLVTNHNQNPRDASSRSRIFLFSLVMYVCGFYGTSCYCYCGCISASDNLLHGSAVQGPVVRCTDYPRTTMFSVILGQSEHKSFSSPLLHDGSRYVSVFPFF